MRLSMLISPSAMFGVRQPSTPDFKAYISRPFFSQHLTDRKPKSWYSRNKAVSFKPCSSFPKSWPVHERQLCFTADSGPVLAQLPNLLNSCTQHSQCTVKCYSSSKLSELSSCCLALTSTFIEFHDLFSKMNSLYQIRSKILHGTKVIIVCKTYYKKLLIYHQGSMV